MRYAGFFAASAAITLLSACSAAVSTAPVLEIAARTAASATVLDIYDFNAQYAGIPRGLAARSDGNLYGAMPMSQSDAGGVYACPLSGPCKFLALFNFQTQGSPSEAPVLATDGNLYGVTFDPAGTFYRLTKSGTLTILHRFNGNDAAFATDLIQYTDGNFYGMSDQGGATNTGNLFRASADGTITNLASCTNTTCLHPRGYTIGKDGKLYGVAGGDPGFRNNGFVFRFDANFHMVKIASFNGTGAAGPGELTQGVDGNFYGLCDGEGSVAPAFFRMTPAGHITIVARYPNLQTPFSGRLMLGRDGNFYAWQFGNINNNGRIMRIAPSTGAITTVATFNGTDGIHPIALTLGTDGNFYSATEDGGANGGGTVVRITP